MSYKSNSASLQYLNTGLTFSECAVALVKGASINRFPDLTGKWVFARAKLSHVPESWTQIRVSTDANDTAKFFNWTVEVDGTRIGVITFYNLQPEQNA
jgi:hypothetical protein